MKGICRLRASVSVKLDDGRLLLTTVSDESQGWRGSVFVSTDHRQFDASSLASRPICVLALLQSCDGSKRLEGLNSVVAFFLRHVDHSVVLNFLFHLGRYFIASASGWALRSTTLAQLACFIFFHDKPCPSPFIWHLSHFRRGQARCVKMERRKNDPRQSSLPSSLIPHLFTAPQQPRDSSTRTTLAPSITPSVAAEEPFDSEQTYMHVVSPSFPMTPLVPHSAFESRPGSRTYFAYESEHHDRQLASSSVNLAELSDQTFHRLEPSMPPVHGQRFASQIYSDPVFHASRPTMPSRTPSYTFPPPATRENVLQRTSWREGEAGPSSLLPAIRTDQRTSRGRRGSSQPARLGPQTEMFERGSSSFDHAEVPFGDMARRENEREGYLLSSGSLGRCTYFIFPAWRTSVD